jgi:non-ribosomal peptide synthetase-like protein
VLVPLDGEVREGVGLLGSPAFEIPRSVDRDSSVDHPETEAELRRRLSAKNRHNLVTIGLFLLVRWTATLGVTLVGLVGLGLHASTGALSVAVASLLSLLFTVFYGVLVERVVTGFRPMTPKLCSIYHPDFWRHERFWKLVANPSVFNGTPFKSLAWQALGARVGRQLFDDGVGMPERSMVTIGDHCTLNAGVTIQCHSQEDGAFKSDRIAIGSGVTIGVGTWVHYATTIGDRAVLAADSFLMKGEEVPANAYWGGNPASEMQPQPAARPALPEVTPAPVAAAPRRPNGRHRAPRELATAHRPLAALHATGSAPRHR